MKVSTKITENLRSFLSQRGIVLVIIFVVSFSLYLWGIQRNLPFTPEIDEPIFVERAIRMASTGNLNPEWFGNPGSTILYPLTLIYHSWFSFAHEGMFFQPNPNLQAYFQNNAAEIYLLGRILSILYAALTVPILFLIGVDVFNKRIAFISVFFFLAYPLIASFVQTVRTDGAGLFFTVTTLWLCIRLYDKPNGYLYLLAGISLGLAIATRYFLVLLIPVWAIVCWSKIWNTNSKEFQRKHLAWTFISLLSIGGAFFVSTPYFFLDFSTAIESIRFEARTTHLGADGFSLVGNFIWYISDVIPQTVGWPQVALIFVGIFKSFSAREFKRMTLVAFLILFIVGISQPALHWSRWAIQIMPILALLAAYGMLTIIDHIGKQNALLQNKKKLLIIFGAMIFTLWPAYNLVFTNIRHANPTTRVLAREWMIDNLAPGSTIAQESFTVPLNNSNFQVTERSELARNFNLSDYSEAFDYIIVKDRIYQVYFDEPERYPNEIEFYQALFADFPLVKQFEPSVVRGGPRIEIYDLKNQQTNQ